MLVGNQLAAAAKDLQMASPQVLCDTMTLSHVYLEGDQPPSLKLSIEVVPKVNERVIVVQNGEARLLEGNRVTLEVPVEWRDDKPHTRRPGQDNFDLIYLRDDGEFEDVQLGVITRDGTFYATSQVIFNGAFVRTRKGLEIIPRAAVNAYPGASFKASWTAMAEALLDMVKVAGKSRQASRVTPATWNPPEFPSQVENRMGGVVLYWNMVTQTGFLLGADGNRYFVHFRDIGSRYHLEPMTAVLFVPTKREGKTKAKFVEPFQGVTAAVA